MVSLSIDDYKNLILRLLPSGEMWEGENLRKLVQAFVREIVRAQGKINQLINEAIPTSAVECLSDWERVCSLPDPYTTLPTTTAGREANIAAKMATTGGQNAAYYIRIASQLGYTITIEDCIKSFTAGSRAGGLLTNTAWQYAFIVRATAIPADQATVGQTVGLPLRVWDSSMGILEYTIERLKPAHTQAVFIYEGIE